MSNTVTFDPYLTYTVKDGSDERWISNLMFGDYLGLNTLEWRMVPLNGGPRYGTIFRQDYNANTDDHRRYICNAFLPACASRWENSPVYEQKLIWERLEAVVLDQLESEFSERGGFFSTFAYDETFHSMPRWERMLTRRKDKAHKFVDFLESRYDRTTWRVHSDFLEELTYVIVERYLIEGIRCIDDRQPTLIAKMLKDYSYNATKRILDLMWQASLPLDEFENIARCIDDGWLLMYHQLSDEKKDDVKAFAVNNVLEQSHEILSAAVRQAVSTSGQQQVVLSRHVIEKCITAPVDDAYAETLARFWHRSGANESVLILNAMYFLKYDEDTKNLVKEKVLGLLNDKNKGLNNILNRKDKGLIVRMGYRVEDIVVEYE